MKKIRGLGDVVSIVATPVGRAFGHPCVDQKAGSVIPGSPCDQRIDRLNDLTNSAYDVFWGRASEKRRQRENATIHRNKKHN